MLRARWYLIVLAQAVVAPLALGQTPRQTRPTTTSCAASASADTTVFALAQVTEPPLIRRLARIHVPSGLLRVGVQLRVVLGLVVNADGKVDPASVTVVDSSGTAFDAEAVRVAKSSTFWPGCLQKNAVRVRVQFPIDYTARMGP